MSDEEMRNLERRVDQGDVEALRKLLSLRVRLEGLTRVRREMAEEAYQEYNFGMELAAADGWEYQTPGIGPYRQWWRTVYLVDRDDQPSYAFTFMVMFYENEALIEDCRHYIKY